MSNGMPIIIYSESIVKTISIIELIALMDDYEHHKMRVMPDEYLELNHVFQTKFE